MDSRFQQELDQLRNKVLEMAAYTEQALSKCIRALGERNAELAQEVIDKDVEINALECEIDELALRLLALEQPVARDLRTIVGVTRMIINLERVGDEAVNVAERAMILSLRPALPVNHMLEELARLAQEMLRTAIKAFKDDDAELAQVVCDMDSRADELDILNLKKLIDSMLQESPAIERSVHTILASRSLERIGDLSTNIAESVIFIAKGVNIKHHCDRF